MRLAATVLLLTTFCSPAQAQERTQYVLAISWQPAFCETRPDRPECASQTAERFDASNFALHGLWPQPRSRDYCGVDAETVRADEAGDWQDLPAPDLSADLTQALAEAMPGTQSGLERHEWIKHGTCYDGDAEAYFADSLSMLEAINASAVATLFAGAVGQSLTQTDIRDAFDTSFGPGAGERVRLSCIDDGNRRLINELTIGLTGDIDGPDSFADRLLDARPTDGGCTGGVVDPVGLQ
ncbi:ribonuclease T2 family protein [Devosia beringensis]|uniref:ribonuclease T2 family protein n=1 Tax=Devosia beringensis TaxID=2657486 RepID=UPI00186B8B5B|nr:ribonuclease [Devosia beringensis]